MVIVETSQTAVVNLLIMFQIVAFAFLRSISFNRNSLFDTVNLERII